MVCGFFLSYWYITYHSLCSVYQFLAHFHTAPSEVTENYVIAGLCANFVRLSEVPVSHICSLALAVFFHFQGISFV